MIVGLTGGIGSGKTTVAALFAQKGAFVIDTDVIAREVVAAPSPLVDGIRSEFGDAVIDSDGSHRSTGSGAHHFHRRAQAPSAEPTHAPRNS